jgi:hypothetical protein
VLPDGRYRPLPRSIPETPFVVPFLLLVPFEVALGALRLPVVRLMLPPELGLLADDFDLASAGDAVNVSSAHASATPMVETANSPAIVFMSTSRWLAMVSDNQAWASRIPPETPKGI